MKLASSILSYLNESRKIKIQWIYQDIIQEMYVSAFNYCVLGYHDELELYLDDEEPKNYEDMIKIFSLAYRNALDKFN